MHPISACTLLQGAYDRLQPFCLHIAGNTRSPKNSSSDSHFGVVAQGVGDLLTNDVVGGEGAVDGGGEQGLPSEISEGDWGPVALRHSTPEGMNNEFLPVSYIELRSHL
jgi:hypothetical protein